MMSDVAQRPESFVREAIVVALLFLRRKPHAANHVGLLAGRHLDPSVPVGAFAIGRASAVGHPDP